MKLTDQEMRAFARDGARQQLERIYEAFPDLKQTITGRVPTQPALQNIRPNMDNSPERKRRTMTEAERKAVSTRMRRYWRNRRAGKL